MTDTLFQLHRESTAPNAPELRMTYLGDGISTDDEELDEETDGSEGASPVPAPVEEGAPEGDDPLQSPDEA